MSFRVSNIGKDSATVHVKSKTAEVFKRGNYWVVRIGDSEAAFLECSGHGPQQICQDPTLDCIRGADPDHVIEFCHRMHGPRAINMAASMLGGVEFRGNPAEDLYRGRWTSERSSPRAPQRRSARNYYAPPADQVPPPPPPSSDPVASRRKWFRRGRDADA